MKVVMNKWNGRKVVNVVKQAAKPVVVAIESTAFAKGTVLALEIETLKNVRINSEVFHANKGTKYLAASSKAAKDLKAAKAA